MSKPDLRESFLACWALLARTQHDGHAYPAPEAEFFFHPTRRWRFDFAWPMALVALEIEGGLWQPGGGGHSHPMGMEEDIQKYNTATFMGWSVIRMADREVRANPVDTCAELARLIKHRLLDGVTDYPVETYGLQPIKRGHKKKTDHEFPASRSPRRPTLADVNYSRRKDTAPNGQGKQIDYGDNLPF